MSVSVLGAGAFGTALAISLSDNGPVTLWSRSAETADRLQRTRLNAKRLPDAPLPAGVSVTASFEQVAENDVILLAVPLQQLRSVLQSHADTFAGKTLVACCKGFELNTHSVATDIILEEVQNVMAVVLSGPSFAADIAKGLPTALTLGCGDESGSQDLQQSLTTRSLRIYTTEDTIGVQLGGALKNVIAIACGAVVGAGLGESARAALMTRGFAEMTRLAKSMGADPRTLAGLSGLGDLALTCASSQSRNFQAGFGIGSKSGETPNATVEGIATALSIAELASEMSLDMPITHTVAALVSGGITIEEAIADLLARPLKKE